MTSHGLWWSGSSTGEPHPSTPWPAGESLSAPASAKVSAASRCHVRPAKEHLPSRSRLASSFPSSPWRIALPVTGHDAANRLDRVDDLREGELGDLASYCRGVLVGARQFGNVRNTT